MSDPIKCCEKIYGGSPWRPRKQCSRNATVSIAGKPYCSQHDPERTKARRDEADKKWREKFEADRKAERIRSAAPDLLEALEFYVRLDWNEFRYLDKGIGVATPEGKARLKARAAIAKAKGES